MISVVVAPRTLPRCVPGSVHDEEREGRLASLVWWRLVGVQVEQATTERVTDRGRIIQEFTGHADRSLIGCQHEHFVMFFFYDEKKRLLTPSRPLPQVRGACSADRPRLLWVSGRQSGGWMSGVVGTSWAWAG